MQTNPLAPEILKLETPRGHLAYRYDAGLPDLPVVVYLHGYASDMNATKAQFLAERCAARQQSFLRFDYSGNGQSDGDFAKGTLKSWIADALSVIDEVTQKDLILVGSSMGGWIGLHCALARRERVKGFIGIAAAPDFTQKIWDEMTPEQHQQARSTGYIEREGSLGPLRMYYDFIQDGNRHLIMASPIDLTIPVILLQGRLDQEVPWATASCIRENMPRTDAEIIIVEDGDHRLARPQDLDLLERSLDRITRLLA